MKKGLFVFFILTLFSSYNCFSQKIKEVDQAIDVLQKWYDPYKSADMGLWETTSWWNSANIITILVKYSEVTGSQKYLPVIDQVFETCKKLEVEENGVKKIISEDFINHFYDDEAWWALAWIDAYNLTKEEKYLRTSKIIFADMASAYDDVCGGGTYWKKPKEYKNSISNGLFLLIALRLVKADPALVVHGKSIVDWAWQTGRWFEQSGLINTSTWLVEDGLSSDCVPKKDSNWTYNQGVIVAVLCEAYQLTKDEKWLTMAEKIAHATMNKLVTNKGILADKNEKEMTGDLSQFKGVFMRHLGLLYAVTKKKEYKDFMVKNAKSIWNNARDKKTNQIGGVWSGPFNKADASTQSSAIDCLLEANIMMK